MRRNGEIIVIEDDDDDRAVLQEVFERLAYPNKITFIQDPMDVMVYLRNPLVLPFLIISDINMPKINGFELREQILADQDVNIKCVPYIFLSTSKNPQNVLLAYQCNAQGYFTKEHDFSSFTSTMRKIVEYWSSSLTPTNSL